MTFRTTARIAGSLFAAIALICLASSARAQLAPAVDLNDGPFGLDVQTLFHGPALKGEGVQWTMIDFRWASMETGSQGNYDFGPTDKIVDYYSGLGFHQIYVLQLAAECPLYPPAAGNANQVIAAITRWAGAVAAHYKGRGLTYEIGNEPEVSSMNGFWSDPDTYEQMARAVAKAIKSADPDAKVMACAVAWMDKGFLTKCFQDGLLSDGTVDYVSFHGYDRDNIMPESGLPRDIEWLRGQVAQYGQGHKIQVVDSERSYGILPVGQPKNIGNWENLVYTEDAQAAYLARHYLTEIKQQIPIIIWYKDMHGETGHSLWVDAETSPRGLRLQGYVYRNLELLLPNAPSTEANGLAEVTIGGKGSSVIKYVAFNRTLATHKHQLVIALWNPIEAFDGNILQSRQKVGATMVETWRPVQPSDPVSIPISVNIKLARDTTAQTFNLLAKTPDEMTAPIALHREGPELTTDPVNITPMPTVIIVDVD